MLFKILFAIYKCPRIFTTVHKMISVLYMTVYVGQRSLRLEFVLCSTYSSIIFLKPCSGCNKLRPNSGITSLSSPVSFKLSVTTLITVEKYDGNHQLLTAAASYKLLQTTERQNWRLVDEIFTQTTMFC